MELGKGKIAGSPYLGVFASVNDSYGLFPHTITKGEAKKVKEFLNIEIIKTSIANSPLLGLLSASNAKGLLVAYTIEKKEKEFLENQGIKVKEIPYTAIGNLAAFNDEAGIFSKYIQTKDVKTMEKFLGIKSIHKDLKTLGIVGSMVRASNKGFVAHPGISSKELAELTQLFKGEGVKTTVNYGDSFVSNGLLANKHGMMAGALTTGHEMVRLDDAFNEV